MVSGSVSWSDTMQGKTIAGLGQQIEEMKSAKNKMLPAIDELRPDWKTEGSITTINDLESFLNDDFEDFVRMFNATVSRLETVRRLSQKMGQTR